MTFKPDYTSNWSKVKKFINTIENDSKITRKEIMQNLKDVSPTTVDIYRKLLTEANVLLYIKPGTYKKIQDIPEQLTTTKLLKFLNLSKWRRWFTPLELFVEENKKPKLLP